MRLWRKNREIGTITSLSMQHTRRARFQIRKVDKTA